MKFRNPETGEVFEDMTAARLAFCRTQCKPCPISCFQNEDETRCDIFCYDHPREAARLMGYEVVEDDTENYLPSNLTEFYAKPGEKWWVRTVNHEKEANMDKPLKDWTLGELSDYCKKVVDPDGNCFNCEAKKHIGLCPFEETAPCDWDFEVKPRFTQQEVEDAKAIKRMFGADNFTHIQKDETGRPAMVGCPTGDDNGWFFVGLEGGRFPSLRPRETVTLDEIIGGAE